ncbi:MAG: crossover junction endodeoxyribonuclease RuvC [Magnetococcales bacterium]|nr:crossover junction endodeoxyribonuclease RuvC [Magnetococcales bacterium]
MRVLGVDPGLTVTGWGVVETDGSRLRAIGYGTLTSDAHTPLPLRLSAIFHRLVQVVGEHRPGVAAVEEVFMARNAASALKLGQARGAAMVAVSSCGLVVHEYSALLIKKSVVGYGRAEKQQVQAMMRLLLSMAELPPADAADALAAAVCHIHHAATMQKLEALS